MTTITIEVPDELAVRLEPVRNQLVEVLELGVTQFDNPKTGLYSDVVAFLASGPPPEDIIAYHPSAIVQTRVEQLLSKNQTGQISPAEAAELDEYQSLNYLVTRIKIHARQTLQ